MSYTFADTSPRGMGYKRKTHITITGHDMQGDDAIEIFRIGLDNNFWIVYDKNGDKQIEFPLGCLDTLIEALQMFKNITPKEVTPI